MSTEEMKLVYLFHLVSEKLKSDAPVKYGEYNALSDKAQKEQEMKFSATDGSTEAREYLKNRIHSILISMDSQVTGDNIDILIRQYHIDYFTNIFTGSSEAHTRTPVDWALEDHFKQFSIHTESDFDVKLNKLVQIIYQELFGYSILDELIFEGDFNEVAANRYDYLWVQYKGIKRRIPNPFFCFKNEEYYSKVVENRLTSPAREEMNAGEPFISCILRNGSRVTAVRPPLSKHWTVSIRCFPDYRAENESHTKLMEEKMLQLVELLASKGRRNIAIIGEQGSGKTTAADELVIRNLDDNLSIGLAEYTHELAISDKYPLKNVVELQYGKQFEPSSITEMFFRFNRDIIIYGEVRNPFEAFEMIKAMLRQARGSLFTFHSSSAARMIHDLRQLLMQTKYYSDYREAQYDAADAVDLVIHIKLDRITGRRYVYKISEVQADEHDMSYVIRNLFCYDTELGKYLVNRDGLSRNMLNSCMEYEMTATDIAKAMELFQITGSDKNTFQYMAEGG